MYDVVTLGETMVRLSPPHFRRLEQTQSFDVNVGGSELSVAVGVSRLGLQSAWVSKLPTNPLGRMIANKAKEQGVDTSHIVWTPEGRVGIYFVEFGSSPRPSSVLYDRKHSAISTIQPGEISWGGIFKQTRLFHVSGITPALSPSAAEVTKEAIGEAKEAGCIVSFDLNYRAKLWSEEEANKCLTPLMEKVDLLFTTEEDTFRVFKIKEENYEKVAERLVERFRFKVVAVTIRENISVWKNNWTGMAYTEGRVIKDRVYEVEIVDRVGAGDSFTAGFLYGYLTGDVEKGVRYGTAFSALKHSIPGDMNWTTLEEVEKLLRGAGLRISR